MKTLARSLFQALLGLLLCLPAYGQRGGEKVPLNILWRVKAGTYDRMTSPNWSEAQNFPFEGATYYVPINSAANRIPLYRLLGGWDHMDSTTAGEGGYATEGAIGYPFTFQPSGTVALTRKYNPTTGDHLLAPSWEAIAGYSNEGLGNAFGYPRYVNIPLSLLSTTAGGVTVKCNGVAGGAVWEWTWNGFQFVNDADYGRQIQSALFFTSETGVTCNPTEAGDAWTAQATPGLRHGSPLLNLHNVNPSYAFSRSIPLEWSPELHGGGADNPVIWKDIVLGKDLFLNFNNLGAVSKYVTYLSTPTLLPAAQLEMPTGYLRATFNRYWTYNAATRVRTEVFPPAVYGQNVQFNTNFGGVIIGNAAGTAANGVYGAHVSQGGSVSYFTLWNFTWLGGTGQYNAGTTKWSAVYGPADIPAGARQFNSYICTGSLANVTAQMDSLYSQNVR